MLRKYTSSPRSKPGGWQHICCQRRQYMLYLVSICYNNISQLSRYMLKWCNIYVTQSTTYCRTYTNQIHNIVSSYCNQIQHILATYSDTIEIHTCMNVTYMFMSCIIYVNRCVTYMWLWITIYVDVTYNIWSVFQHIRGAI